MNKLDLTYLNEISGGDKNFIREMLDLFVASTANEVNQFDALLNNADYDKINSLAHKMKAPIQMLGASQLFETVKTIETIGRDKQGLEQLPNLIGSVKTEIEDLKEEILDVLKSL